MRPSQLLECADFPCQDVNKKCYVIPNIEIEPDKIRTLMISEAPPENSSDYFYAAENPFYLQTTSARAYKHSTTQASKLPR